MRVPFFCFLFLIGSVASVYAGPGMLETLPQLPSYTAARVSSHDKTGGNRDYLASIQPGETAVLADIEGPGIITHIWCTIAAEEFHGRKIVLRMYWDGNEEPCVVSPINDFFCMGHGINSDMWSIPITTTSNGRARNCYFHMPFNKRARIEITNEGMKVIGSFYYYIDYRQYEEPLDNCAYFHAHYRQEYPATPDSDYVVLNAEGKGQYVGTTLSIESLSEGWWGEGDDRFYIDGEEYPSLHGTGTEDYLNDAWGIWPNHTPFYGSSIKEGEGHDYHANTLYTSYRFHITDPIPFKESLRFTLEHYGAGQNDEGETVGFVERGDNWSSVAYWYQTEPHNPLPPLAPVDERLPQKAAHEKVLLTFLRRAGEVTTKEEVSELRGQYEDLLSDPNYSEYQTTMLLRMAHAEAIAGDRWKSAFMIKEHMEPFIDRRVYREFVNDPDIMNVELKPDTPMLVEWADGSAIRMRKQGRIAIRTNTERGKPHVYFAFPKDSPLKNIDATAIVTISYYSEGTPGDSILVEYDSNYSQNISGWYYDAKVVDKPDEPGWYAAEVKLPRARFGGGQNGASDFRITSNEDGDEYIASVEVRLEEPKEE